MVSPSNHIFFVSTSGTNTIPGGYMTSFYKKDGSSGHRRHQGPSMESIASSEGFTWHFVPCLIDFPYSFLLIHVCFVFFFYFRLCNMAVWSESDKLLCQQELPESAASPSSADCPWENRLVCQIWPPLVCLCGALMLLKESLMYYRRDLRIKKCSHVQRLVLVL